jgi:hypothetical protein
MAPDEARAVSLGQIESMQDRMASASVADCRSGSGPGSRPANSRNGFIAIGLPYRVVGARFL